MNTNIRFEGWDGRTQPIYRVMCGMPNPRAVSPLFPWCAFEVTARIKAHKATHTYG